MTEIFFSTNFTKDSDDLVLIEIPEDIENALKQNDVV